MSVSKKALSTLEDPVALGAIQASGGSFADTPERRAYENAREAAAANAANDAAGFQNAVTRALQPDPNAVLDALDAQKMTEPSSRVRSALRAARTMAYARDILKNPGRYQDGDAFAALDALSDGFAHDVSEWKRVQGMTKDDPRRNLATYVGMLDELGMRNEELGMRNGGTGYLRPAGLPSEAQDEPSAIPNSSFLIPTSPYAAYYEATRSQETRDWDALASAPLDVRFSHAVAKDPGGWRLTDAAKDWVHANLFDEDRITPEEEAAWVASEGGYDADAMRRYFANRSARGKGAKDIVRDRERQRALEGAAGVIVKSKLGDGRIPDQDYLVNPRQGKDGKIEYDRIEKLTDLTLKEYAETEKRRDDFVMKRRVVDAYQKRMEKKVAEDRAHAMLPFLNEYEAAAALSALRGEDMAKYKSFFENGFGSDTERRDMVWSVCASLRPRDAHGAWEDLIGRFGEGVDRAAFLTGKAASSLWNSYTRWPEIVGTLAASGQEAAIAEKKQSDEELKAFTKEMNFQLQYRQTMEAWIPNADDNFAEQAVKGLADSGFLQGAAVTASLAHIGGSALLRAPHPAARIGGAVLHGVGYLTDAFGAASMVGDSFENMMLNGVDAERAAVLGLYAGCLNYLIEKGDVDMFLGKGLSPAELRKTGFRALFKAIAKKDPRLVAEALKADAKNAGRVAVAECAEEFGQALVDSGALKFAKGDEFSAAAFADAYLNRDTLKDGVDAFIDALPTCTGFGLMSLSSPLHGKNAQAVDAYAQLADETAKRYALQYHIDTANAEDMAKVRRLVLENAARHARAAANMDDGQRRIYFGKAALEAGMSPSEAAFYEQAADLYRTLSAFEGQQFADAAMHGEINEAVLERAGIAVGHDENGYVNSVTVDGHTRTVVTERGTRVETDAHTGETGNVRGYYDPKDGSIHITVPEAVSDVGETARTTTAPHELLHAALEAMANDPALTEEQRRTLDALLKTETPSPNGTKLDANEAAAQFVERVFAVANRDFTPDREVVALGNVVRNVGIALKKALGSKSEYLPAIVRKAGKGGISITDLLDPSFLADLDALQIAAEDKGTADPVVAWYASTMQPFFKALVDAKTRAETTANLDAAEAEAAAERGDTRGDSAAAGIALEIRNDELGIRNEGRVDSTEKGEGKSAIPNSSFQTPNSPSISLPNGYSAECEVVEMPIGYVVMPGDPDYDAHLADLNALHEAEPEDGVPVVAGGGNLLCGVNAIRRALAEGKTRITVRRIRRLRKDKQPSGQISAAQEAKRTGVRRFLEVHGNAYPALRYWLEHGRHIIDGSDPYIKAYLDRLSTADRMFLTGFGKGGTAADALVEEFLNQYRSAAEQTNERHYDGTMKPEDVLDQALRERDAYRQWKADGRKSPDSAIPNSSFQIPNSSDIDAQIAADVAAGFFSLVREYDDIIGDQLAAMTDAPRFSIRSEITVRKDVASLRDAEKYVAALAGKKLHNDATGIDAEINAVQRRKIFSNAAVKKSTDNGFTVAEHNAAAAIIDKLWKHAELAKEHDDRSGNRPVRISRFVSLVGFADKDAYAYITAKSSVRDGTRVYSIELEKLEMLEGKLKGLSLSSSSIGRIVSKLRAKVNGAAPRYSLSPAADGGRYSWDRLVSLPNMPLTQLDPAKFKNYKSDAERVADAYRSVIEAGGEKVGDNHFITMDGEKVLVGSDGIKHRGKTPNLTNDFLFPNLGNVLKNAVRVNELNPRVGNKKDDFTTDTFVYLGAMAYGNEVLPVRIQVAHRGNNSRVDRIDVLKSLNTKIGNYATQDRNVPLATELPLASLPEISIADLIEIAQPLHPQIFSRDVANALGVAYEGDAIDARYSLARTPAEQAVYDRWHNADGTPRRGWMLAPNGKQTRLTERQWLQVRTPAFKKWFGDWEKMAKLNAIDLLEPIAVTDRTDGVSAEESYASLADGVNETDGRRVRFVRSTLGKIVRHKGFDTSRIVHQLKDIFDKSVPVSSEAEKEIVRPDGTAHKRHPNLAGYHTYVGKIDDGGKTYYVRFTVQEEKTRSKAYNPNAVHSTFVSDVAIYNSGKALSQSTTTVGESELSRTDNILANIFADFNGAANECSKVVDDNGEPLVVWHGTREDFTAFDKGRIRSANWGIGFYFTSFREDAEHYARGGKVMSLFLNVRNPLDLTTSANDAEYNRWYGKKKSPYDGYVVETGGKKMVVAVSPEQVKSATDNTGAFGRDNADIRYSVAEPRGVQKSANVRYPDAGAEIRAMAKRETRFGMSDRAVDALDDISRGKAFGTLHNDEYGDIAYHLGITGKRGMGLAHIVESRMAKDGATLDEAIETAIGVADAAERGTVANERLNTKHFDLNGIRAIVAFDEDGNKVITGYEISAEASDGAVRRSSDPESRPHVGLDEIVAALKDRIAKLREERKGVRYSFASDAKDIIVRKRPDLYRSAWIASGSAMTDDELLAMPVNKGKTVADLNGEAADAVVAELVKFDTPKKRKAALNWFVKGAIRLPEDAPKVEEAIRYGENAQKRKGANADPLAYDSPMAMVDALHEFKPREKPIDPDTVPELSDKTEMGHGVTTYLVQDDEDGQKAMRRIINTHWGEDANPWCLLHGDGHGNLSDGTDGGYDARHYWKHYSALPKRVAFRNGKLLAFMATDADFTLGGRNEAQEQWWDREDKSHAGIPIGNRPVPNDRFGRSADFTIQRDGTIKPEGEFVKRTKDYEITWNENGTLSQYKTLDANGGRDKSYTWRYDGELVYVTIPATVENMFGKGSVSHTLDVRYYPPVNDKNASTFVEMRFLSGRIIVEPDKVQMSGERDYLEFDGNGNLDKEASIFTPYETEDGHRVEMEEFAAKKWKMFQELKAQEEAARAEADRIAREYSATGTRFSLHVNPNLRADVEAMVSGHRRDGSKVIRHERVVFSSMPDLLVRLGLPDVNIESDRARVQKIVGKHGLTYDQIADIPNRCSTPVAVFKDGESAYVILTDMTAKALDGKTKPVMVRLTEKVGVNGESVFVASAYSRDSDKESEYVRLVNTPGCALYFDENKVAALGLEEGTKSTLCTLTGRDDVMTPEDYSSAVNADSIAYPGADVNGDYEPRYSIRVKEPPKRTGIGYKAFYRAKDGKLYPPMVANPNGADTPVGVWLDADEGVRADDSKTGRKKVKAGGKGTKGGSGSLAWRPGWHLGKIPYALQFNVGDKVPNPLGITNKKGEVIEVGRYFPANLVWGEVEYAADVDYQDKAHEYGVNANGNYEHAKAGLPYLPTDGSYEYRTNPNPATDPWIITGAMKVNRILKRDEVDELVRKAGREPQRVEPRYSLHYLGGADLTVEDNARYFKKYITSIKPAAEPERIADGSPKSVLEWFLANMVGNTYSFDIPGIGKRVFTPKAGHIGKLVCSGKGKGIISKPYEGQWIDAVLRGDISGSDVNGWDYDRAKSLPLIDDMLTSFDALIYDESRDTPSVVFLKRYVRKDGKTNTIVMRVVSDGDTIGPVSAHVKDVTLSWLMDKKRLVVNEDGQLYGMGKDNSASDAHLPSADAENQSAGSGNSIAYPAADVNAPRFSLSLGIEGEGDPFAAKNNPVDFLLAHRIFANGGKIPSRKETDKLLKRFGSKEQPRDVLARAVSLSQNIAGFLDRIGQDPEVVRAVAAAGLALEAKGAQTRARNALMQFDAKAAEAKGKIDAAYRRQVENASGIGYREMLSYYGLDMEQILLAMPPPPQNRAKAAKDAAGDAPKPNAYELTDADRAAVDAAVAAIVSRGEGLAAAANAEHPGRPVKASLRDASAETSDDAEADPAFLRAQAMNAAVVEAVRKSGITVDNPLAMVALVRRLTEDYVRRNPDAVPDFNDKDPFASRVALAVFAANLSQFAQAVAQGYAPSYARVRVARLCERLDGRGLTTLKQVERVGEMIFADLSRDVIRQSRAELMRNLHDGDAPKKGGDKDPNRWRGIDWYAKKHGVNLAEPDRVVSAFAGNYLRILRRVVELSQAKAAERAAMLQQTVDAFKDTDDKAKYRDYQNALLELDILAAYGALRTKMPAEIADKVAAIRAFVMQDLDALNKKKEAFEQKRVALRDAMTAAIAGNPKDNGRMPDRHPGFLYSLVGMLEARASVLTSFCKDPARRQAALDAFAYVQRLLFHGYTQERAFLNDAKVAMRDAVKSVFGRFGQNTFAKLLDTKLDEATCKLLDRGGQKTKWRIGNVMQMYVSCLQSDYAENCKAHGRDAAYVQTLKTVIEKADPRLLRMIDVMRDMYAWYGKEISKATLSASGVPIQTPNPLYMPVKPLLLMRAKNGEGRAFHPYAPALTPRVRHGYDFDQSADIMELWQDRIQQSAHTIGFLEAAPLIQGTMQSSHVLEAIRAAWGEQYANHWNDYVLTCLAGRKAASMPKVMAALSRAASRLFLWFNVGSNLNQLQAVFTSALSHDVGGMCGMAKHLSFWALKPVEMWQAARDLTATRAFRARYGSDLNAAVAAAQREGKYGVLRSAVGTVADVGMKGIEIGDKVGVLALANVYRAERIALENAGMDPAEASEQAAEKLMLIAENTAQGTTDMNTFDEQSRIGSLTSLFMQFKTAPLQQFGYEFAAFQDWKAAPTDPKRAMKLLSVILVNHVLASIVPTAIDAFMTAMFGAMRGDDDREKEKNRRCLVARALARAFLGPFGAVMFYGVIADNAVQFVANWMTEGKPVRKPYGRSGSLPADNAVEMMANAVEGGASALFKAVENGTVDDLWKTSIDVLAEFATMTYPGRIYKKTRPKKKK